MLKARSQPAPGFPQYCGAMFSQHDCSAYRDGELSLLVGDLGGIPAEFPRRRPFPQRFRVGGTLIAEGQNLLPDLSAHGVPAGAFPRPHGAWHQMFSATACATRSTRASAAQCRRRWQTKHDIAALGVLDISALTVALPQGADRHNAVENISINVAAARSSVSLASRGSGKSMIAHTVMGLLPPALRATERTNPARGRGTAWRFQGAAAAAARQPDVDDFSGADVGLKPGRQGREADRGGSVRPQPTCSHATGTRAVLDMMKSGEPPGS